jgi:hypothetical protein
MGRLTRIAILVAVATVVFMPGLRLTGFATSVAMAEQSSKGKAERSDRGSKGERSGSGRDRSERSSGTIIALFFKDS